MNRPQLGCVAEQLNLACNQHCIRTMQFRLKCCSKCNANTLLQTELDKHAGDRPKHRNMDNSYLYCICKDFDKQALIGWVCTRPGCWSQQVMLMQSLHFVQAGGARQGGLLIHIYCQYCTFQPSAPMSAKGSALNATRVPATVATEPIRNATSSLPVSLMTRL